ncbi:hypothetical protein BJ994_001663 [Arthrobacter pigmenti]|uniref:Aminoglycoside phosphotransferase domain-containing protein n=1 Tax=Arthrobacter pigmenti TaxID=271432 RepID=A0A846RQZ3_9MICC|nr:hypothetical protein [Arthrobacter pigmenti]
MTTPLDPGLAALDLFFDADALSSLLGRPARAGHLRWKRGVSAIARLHDDDGVRWLAAYSKDAAVKLEKTFRRAGAHGLPLEQYEIDGGVLASGPIALDPRLYGALRPFRGFGDYFASPAVRVLKYNPFRRLVFAVDAADSTAEFGDGGFGGTDGGGSFGWTDRGTRGGTDGGTLVGRVSAAAPWTTPDMLAGLAANGVPLLVPLSGSALAAGTPTGKHVHYLPWYGEGDLSTVQPAQAGAASYAAGEALSLLHRQPPVHQSHAWRAPAGRLMSLVRENAALIPESGDRLTRVRSALEPLLRRPGRAAMIHGDFSADQVLVDGSDVRLIDFERCTYGAAASDLGSFAAMEALGADSPAGDDVLALPRTAALLDGYSAGPDAVNESEVLGWTVFFLLNRLREPFRACMPGWRQQMDNRLAMIEGVLW